jgi:glycine oxidase
MKAEVVILGGGVIGLTTAYLLAQDGVRVQVLDRAALGKEASWAGAGIIPPSRIDSATHPFDRLRALSVAAFPHFSRQLREETGIDNGYFVCGGLEFDSQHEIADQFEWRGDGVPVEALTREDVSRLEPALSSHLGCATRIADLAQVRNPWHLRALIDACCRTGKIDLREKIAVGRIEVHGSRAVAVETSEGRIEADQLLISAGAWTDELLKPLGCRLRIEPVRGQIVLLNAGGPLFRHVLIQGARYLVPRTDGRVLVGSTEEHVGFVKATTPHAIRDLIDLAVRMVPALADAAVEQSWAGLRPSTPDGLPYLGRVPTLDNVFVGAGHFRSGIQLSIGSAVLLREMMRGQPLSLPIDAFRLDRGDVP